MKKIKSMLKNNLFHKEISICSDLKNIDIHDDKIELAFIWTGDGHVDGLDLAALVLNSEQKMSLASDFVYFNSKYRVDTIGATPKLFEGVKNIYRFYPSNKESSVVLDGEFSLYLEEKDVENCESVYIDLGKLDTKQVSSIAFCVCNYSKEFAFKYLESLTVCIYSVRKKKVLHRYSISNFPKHTKDDILYLGSLEYSRENKNWILYPSFVLMYGWWNKVIEKYI